MGAVPLLVLAVLLAGCSGQGPAPSAAASTTPPPSSAAGTAGTSSQAAPANGTRLMPEELLNQTFTFQMGSSVAPASFEVTSAWTRLNLTATLRNTSQCYALLSEARTEGSVSAPSVTVTPPSGSAFEVPLVAAAGCQPGSPPDFLAPVSAAADGAQGSWAVQPRGWGQNMELRFVALALP